MKEKIIEMLELQDKMNTHASHAQWRDGITLTGKIINWRRCVYMETAEAIDSVSWKHWKDIGWWIDYENFKVELIDIWHFLMSYLLTQNSVEKTAEIIEEHMIWNVSSTQLPLQLNAENNLQLDTILEPYENLMALSLQKIDTSEYQIQYIKTFFTCLDSAGVDFEDLYSLYIWKNVLNIFRQDHWYKEWTYTKIWFNGKEDNVTMQDILKSRWTMSFDDLYSELKKEYIKNES